MINLNEEEILLIGGGNGYYVCLGKCFSICHLTYGIGDTLLGADTGMEQWCVNNCYSECN